MYIIRELLNNNEVDSILKDLDGWSEGYTKLDSSHKNNSELNSPEKAAYIANKIKQCSISADKIFMKRMTLPRFNKYEQGQHYSKHIDAFKQEGIQTDWSYTLMLQPPIKGGELELNLSGRTVKVDLGPGDVVIYPSGNIHQVLPVEEGTRLAAIGWIESLITRADEREILVNLIDSIRDLESEDTHKETILKLSYTYHNLLRMWSK